jgi:hypothetical protein
MRDHIQYKSASTRSLAVAAAAFGALSVGALAQARDRRRQNQIPRNRRTQGEAPLCGRADGGEVAATPRFAGPLLRRFGVD